MDNSLKHTQFDLENPKNALQYQCYKTSLSIQMLFDNLTPAIKQLTTMLFDNLTPAIKQLTTMLFDNLTPAIKQLTTVLSEFAQKLTAALLPFASAAFKRRKELLLWSLPEVQTAAEHYPRIAHLASHAKKRRVRLKNLRRLQKQG